MTVLKSIFLILFTVISSITVAQHTEYEQIIEKVKSAGPAIFRTVIEARARFLSPGKLL